MLQKLFSNNIVNSLKFFIKVPCKNVDPDRISPKLLFAPAGKPINFTCLSDSKVTWTHNGKHPSKNVIIEKNGNVHIPKITVHNRGTYQCLGYIQQQEHFLPFSSKLVIKVIGMLAWQELLNSMEDLKCVYVKTEDMNNYKITY